MKNITAFKFTTGGLCVAILGVASTGLATPIVGSMGFTGMVGLDLSPASATEVTDWINPVFTTGTGLFASGGYAISSGTPATFSPVFFQFDTTTTNTDFISLSGFTMELSSSSTLTQGGIAGVTGFVAVDGLGIISGNGYNSTPCDFNFTCQDPAAQQYPTAYAFSASITAVPEPSTLALAALGGLGSLGLIRRRK